MGKLTWIIIIVIALVAGWFFITNNSEKIYQEVKGDITNQLPENNIVDDQPTGATKTFILTGKNYKFMMDGTDNPEIKVNVGDKVIIEFTSVGGFHDWVVDEFDASTKQVKEGGSTSVEFIANKKGTFEYYCSVGNHRAQGMFGKIIVE